jgi:hypothetical protein
LRGSFFVILCDLRVSFDERFKGDLLIWFEGRKEVLGFYCTFLKSRYNWCRFFLLFFFLWLLGDWGVMSS